MPQPRSISRNQKTGDANAVPKHLKTFLYVSILLTGAALIGVVMLTDQRGAEAVKTTAGR